MKTNLDSLFKTNQNLEDAGVWFDVSEKTGFLLRRFGGVNSSKIKATVAKIYKPYTRQVESGTLDPAKERELEVRIFVETCVLNWRGIEIDGMETPFEKELAIKFFLSLPELTNTLTKYATDVANYKDDLGNF